MSYNGSGLFQINTSGQPVVAGTVITASAFNALTADLATGLTTAITKDGQTATTAQIPFAQGLRSTLVTDSTTSTSGSIITDGGLGIAKAANIGTTLGVTGAITGSSTITGTKLIPTGTSATGNGMYLPATNTLGFSTNGTLAAVIDANQNVGVGVTPSAWGTYKAVQVVGGSLASYAANDLDLASNCYWNGTNYIYLYNQAATHYRQVTGAHQWYNAASGTAGNAITFTQAMTLDASGNLLVGTTTGASSTSALMQLKKGGVQWDTGPNGSNGSFNVLKDGTTGVYLTSGATSWSGLSDETMKDIIEPIENASQKISTLRTVIGKYKTDEEGTRRAFLIAQDVKEVLPEAVNENENGKLGLQYTDVMPLLVAAIKEQQALITQLQADVAALKG